MNVDRFASYYNGEPSVGGIIYNSSNLDSGIFDAEPRLSLDFRYPVFSSNEESDVESNAFVSWDDARRSCVSQGGHLVTFNTFEEITYVMESLYTIFPFPPLAIYIGLHVNVSNVLHIFQYVVPQKMCFPIPFYWYKYSPGNVFSNICAMVEIAVAALKIMEEHGDAIGY